MNEEELAQLFVIEETMGMYAIAPGILVKKILERSDVCIYRYIKNLRKIIQIKERNGVNASTERNFLKDIKQYGYTNMHE